MPTDTREPNHVSFSGQRVSVCPLFALVSANRRVRFYGKLVQGIRSSCLDTAYVRYADLAAGRCGWPHKPVTGS